MENKPFAFSSNELCDFYQLRGLNPKDSWLKDSTVVYSLREPQGLESVGSSYAVLNELLRQEHEHITDRNSGIDTAGLQDPLNPRLGLDELLDSYQISTKERHKYYINSKKFNSKLYLRGLHSQDGFKDLSSSLDLLDRSLQAQSNDLKKLVQNNFAKYVRSKNNLDRIYEQFNRFSLEEDKELGTEKLGASVDNTIQEVTLKAKPILDTNAKLKNIQTTMTFIQENRDFFDIPKKLRECLMNRDFSQLMRHYHDAQRIYQDLTTSGHSFPILLKMWDQIESTINSYRDFVWEALLNPVAGEIQVQLLPLISKLLELNSEESPIFTWISSKLTTYESKLEEIVTKMHAKIVTAQQKVIRSTSSEGEDLTFYLSIGHFVDQNVGASDAQFLPTNKITHSNPGLCDSVVVIEMWLLIQKLTSLLSMESSLFVEFWEHVEKFLDGTYQNSLLNDKRKDDILGTNVKSHDSYMRFLKFEKSQVSNIRLRGEEYIKRLCNGLSSLFSASQTSLREEAKVEKETGSPIDYGFIPPAANCLSCLRYLPQIVEPILKFTTEIAQLNISPNSIEILRKCDAMILDRAVAAISATKLRDLSAFHTLEDWSMYRSSGHQKYGITQFPEIVCMFQKLSIVTVRNMLFSYEKLPVLNGIYVVTHPSRQLLTGIEVQQIISMEAVLESVLKDAAKEKENPRTSRTILTLTNLQYTRERIFPEVLQFFDESFETQLGKKNLEIFNLLGKMESSIFGNYLSDLKVSLRDILEERFYEINWATYSSNSFRVGDYMIETLMILVSVHSDCFRIAPQLIGRILKESQIFISKYLFEAFKRYIGNLSSDALLQIVVDLQFFLKVLGNLLERDTEATLMACLENCFENDSSRLQRCITETGPIVSANLKKASAQFASFR
ncbi:LANO_0H05512g1_1 [Lachancea nothofagi CBS 11611]|uniref:Exocyst complex component SEC5 n=1 Tax=Lachancea nothofagi CBS 11611 TaxID=1266666 RepID=A0A1G4KLC8_9SACH|nr:LANO_0H05512g1_1 [Lachancea nothofagi CBS 11611]